MRHIKYLQVVKRNNCHRSYYRCSEKTCTAKKTVERDLMLEDGKQAKVVCVRAHACF